MGVNDYDYGWQLFVLLLKNIADQKGITHQQIADAVGIRRSNLTRIFSCMYKPNLDIFIKIAKAVGVNFYFEDQDGGSDLNVAFEKAMKDLGRRGFPDEMKN